MLPTHADLLVIGFGKGGKTLLAAMGRQGNRVVMVEQSGEMYGGTVHQHRVRADPGAHPRRPRARPTAPRPGGTGR